MERLSESAEQEEAARRRPGRVLGWLSGLGLLVVPWIAAGVLATLGTMVGPESWNAERTFPWVLLVTFVGGLGWVAWGSVRISGFRQGAVPGTLIALAVLVGIGGVYALGVLLA